MVEKPLRQLYPDKEAFLRDVPRLIIEHNLHGIDIDPRCAQIAGLSLWLRAQKAWQRLGLKSAERPAIKRSNIVCAEPMPGEKELLREFVEREFPAEEQGVFLRLLEAIFDKMQLAGEAGSLLKIEEEIKSAVEEAQKAWTTLQNKPLELFSTVELNKISSQQELETDSALRLLPSDFWETAEDRVIKALQHYAESADSHSFQRRLFAEDAARGFAFIDVCRKRYDVALMNPPFGDASLPSKPYIEETYGDTKGDVYKAFVECFHARLVPVGYLGIISSRTGFFLGQSEDWRTRVVLRLFRPIALADLGSGVLDAMVEVAAYVLRSLSAPEARDLTLSIVPVLEKVVRDSQDRFSLPKWQAARGGLKRHQAVSELEHLEAHGFVQRSPGDIVRYTPLWHSVKNVTALPEAVYSPLVCVRALGEKDKGAALADFLSNSSSRHVFVSDPAAFREIPSSPFAYWVTSRVRSLFKTLPKAESESRRFTKGLCTTDDERFLRAHWEILPADYGTSVDHFDLTRSWASFAKGGEAKRFYTDTALVLKWAANGSELKAFLDWKIGKEGQWSRWVNSVEYYFRPGLTWPLRAAQFSPQVLPAGCIFSVRGYAAFAPQEDLPWLLGLTGSSAFDFLFKTLLGRFGFPEFVVGALQQLPIPELPILDAERLGKLAGSAWAEKRRLDSAVSTSHAFQFPALRAAPGSTLAERAAAWAARVRTSEETVAAIQAEIDDLAFRLYGLDAPDRAALTSTLATETTGDAKAGKDEEEEAATADAIALVADLLGYGLGVAFGRWDIRYATGEQAAPELPDPFAPLPVCPPGQLQSAEGLPIGKDEVRRMKDEGRWNYPIEIPWDGILVDDPNHPLDIERRVREVIEVIWGQGSAAGGRVQNQRSDGLDSGALKLGAEPRTLNPAPCSSAEAIEAEACEILVVKSLRDYFRKPAGFFADHLKRYSKSRRQAPIYWPLSSPKNLYTVWLYYHRLTADTLFTVLRDHVKPKLEYEERRAFQLKQEAGTTPSPSQRKEIADAEDLVEDLRGFQEELNRVAPLFNPNLNDGVIINHAPLWRMAAHNPWQKKLKECWDALVNGKYDWAHLALHLWPERVVPKCATDRSLAIAHDLEEFFWEPIPEDEAKPRKTGKRRKAKAAPDEDLELESGDSVDEPSAPSGPSSRQWRPKNVPAGEVQKLIAARISPAVKAALEALTGGGVQPQGSALGGKSSRRRKG